MEQTKEIFAFLKKYKNILLIAGIPLIAGIIPIYFQNLVICIFNWKMFLISR